ncbi:MAG: hypothetical protein H0U21_17020 [Acidimicrobiia bacterium]|nr:hypothetical protein [Acidimicrobiia bacterium]
MTDDVIEHDEAIVDAPPHGRTREERPAAPAPAPIDDDLGDDDFDDDVFDATPADGYAAASPHWAARAGRRILRRPTEWFEAPWTTERAICFVVTAITLLITTVVMMNVVHFNPLNPEADLIFDRTTPTGGDMGSHVWGPSYLRDSLLSNFQISGWTMDWYAGMPAYRFYMVVPALAITMLDVLVPYGVAFKLVAISGLVTFPAACWAFGRLARFRYPLPELFAFAGLLFALDESFSIYGGNLKSTMAGEFSFSIALTLGMLGLGMLAHTLRTGRNGATTAVLLALSALCHGLVGAFYIAPAALVLLLVWISWKRLAHGALVGVTALLLSLFWYGPFMLNHQYMTDMKYGGRPEGASDSFWDMFFPLAPPLDVLVMSLAVIGFVACVARGHRTGTALGVTALGTVVLTYATQGSLPVIGLLWNPRLLPWIYLLRYLLMMIGIIEVAGYLANLARNRAPRERIGWGGGSYTFGAAALGVLVVLGFMFEVLPGGQRHTIDGAGIYGWGPFYKTPHPDDDKVVYDAQGDGWSSYNFRGYEGREHYPEYHDLVQTMADIGRTEGCGRATWENNSDNGRYGTTMALMLLPHWTDGCIQSMEGLFFEASGTTPYHFLATAAISENSSNPVRELRYVDNDAAVGVQHLRDLGVSYLMVRTDPAKAEARAQDDLELLAKSGPWEIYRVVGSTIVEPLAVQPVVVNHRGGDQRERNLELGTSWFQHQDEWVAMPADDGPDSWPRIDVRPDESRLIPDPNAADPDTRGKQVDIVVPEQTIQPVALAEITVSDVQMGDQSLSFRVDQVGVPVLVRVSYFPNWSVEGAEGPYRIAPNFMVVVPTSTDVSMQFEPSSTDLFFYVVTFAGIALAIVMWRRGLVRVQDATADAGTPPPPPAWGPAPPWPDVVDEPEMSGHDPPPPGPVP